MILKPGNKAWFQSGCTAILVLAYFPTPIDTSTATLVSAPTSGTGSGELGEIQIESMERISVRGD